MDEEYKEKLKRELDEAMVEKKVSVTDEDDWETASMDFNTGLIDFPDTNHQMSFNELEALHKTYLDSEYLL